MSTTTGRVVGLRRVLDDLGATLLELTYGRVEAGPQVSGVVFYDPLDHAVIPARSLVLGVGVGEAEEVARLLDELGTAHAAALVVRAPVPRSAQVLAAAERSGVALLGLTRGATWAQLAAMLRMLIAEDDVAVSRDEFESLSGLPAGDLFALANAIAALLDAPITIEDRNNAVLAFSGRQDETDAGRIETVLGLQVPARYTRVLTERGVFRELYRSNDPVVVEPVGVEDGVDPPTLPRAAIAVRAGDDILGSIWAVLREPLNDERRSALSEAATLTALHLLRVRAGTDVERRLRTDLVGTALEGGPGSQQALRRLALNDQPVIVVGLAVVEPAGTVESSGAEAARDLERRRLGDAFALHLSAIHPRAASAVLGHTAYGLLPLLDDGDAEARATRMAADFLERIGDRFPAVVAVGPLAHDGAGLTHARECADRTLRVLQEERRAGRVARLEQVYVASLVLELRDLAAARGDRLTGPLARLSAYDAAHRTRLVETLRTWLDTFGDVNAAAAAVFVHPNTFRYRLRRLGEVGELDLTDSETRFSALLQLRLLAP